MYMKYKISLKDQQLMSLLFISFSFLYITEIIKYL